MKYTDLTLLECPFQKQRYMEALARLDLCFSTPETIRVDGRGWSPEIAAQAGKDYLSISETRSYAIIVDVSQLETKIINFRISNELHSLTHFYQSRGDKLEALSLLEPLVLELTSNAAEARLAGERVTTMVSILEGPLLSESARQVKAARYIEETKGSCLNEKLISALQDSVNTYGDLRGFYQSRCKAETLNVRSTFSRKNYSILYEDWMQAPVQIIDFQANSNILRTLEQNKLITTPWEIYRLTPETFSYKKQCLEVQLAWSSGYRPDKFHLMSLRRFLRNTLYAGTLNTLEQIEHQLHTGQQHFDPELPAIGAAMFAVPAGNLAGSTKLVVDRLLAQQFPFDLRRLKLVDYQFFYNFINNCEFWISDWARTFELSGGE